MDFLELAKKRYSCRAYETRAVEPEKIDRIIEAAHVAPTAGNRQPARLIVVESDKGLAKLNEAGNMYEAPLAIIVCADHDRAWTRRFDGMQTTDIDASILCDHMMLEATNLGLGSCWICAFDPDVVKRAFNLPASLEPVNILATGYAAIEPADANRHKTQRIPVDELIHERA